MTPIEKDGICPRCRRRFTARAQTFPDLDDAVKALVAEHLFTEHEEIQ